MYRNINTRKIIFLLHYRGGSTFFEVLLGKEWRKLQAQGKIEECYKVYKDWRNSKQPFLLPTREACPCEDDFTTLFSPEIWTTFSFFSWTLHLGDWWGNLKSKDIPLPYQIETPSRYACSDLKKFPEGNWKFVQLVRDGRNQISSLRNFKGGFEEICQKEDPEDYFISLCKGWRNKIRIALDNQSLMPDDYSIFTFEDLIKEPAEVVAQMFNFVGLTPNSEFFNNLPRYDGKEHSSFKKLEEANKRWQVWTEQEKDIFKSIANKELVELGYEQGEDW